MNRLNKLYSELSIKDQEIQNNKEILKLLAEKMYETHHGMSKLYEVSCEELDFLNDVARAHGVTGSRVMGGGFGGCTINLVKDALYDSFIQDAKAQFSAKYGHEPGLKAYTHVSDQFGPFATQTIPATVNEAAAPVDRLLGYATPPVFAIVALHSAHRLASP